jgi:lipopolysaccharide/colanic/teichoic acid biosynthesis glycosyltransferase
VFKRTTDVLFAAILFTLTLPLLATAAILIKLDSEGPVIFCQARMGRGFRRFQLYKLRTMNVFGSGPAYTLGADPRITRVGRWLRHAKIDELPQLWNVLRGEMSIVGPRPVIPRLAMEFGGAYERLLTVRPGLTDPASLKYCDETEILRAAPDPEHYFKTIVTPDKLRISEAYLLHANPWTDVAVVAKTALALASPRIRRHYSRGIPTWKGTARELIVFPVRARIGDVCLISEVPSKAPEFEVPVAIIGESVRPSSTRGGKSLSV